MRLFRFLNARYGLKAIRDRLDVVGHSSAHSFACVDVASDSADAEQRMMSPDHVKVSIPYEAGRPPTEIHSGAAWAAISLLAG